MPYSQKELDLANDHLSQLAEMVAKQSARVEELRRGGHPTDHAQRLLVLLIELRQQIALHRAKVVNALATEPAPEVC
jgi:hypothetical protein